MKTMTRTLPLVLLLAASVAPVTAAYARSLSSHELGLAGESTALDELSRSASPGATYRLSKTNSPSTDILRYHAGRPTKWIQVKSYAPDRAAAAVADGLYDALTAYADKPGLATGGARHFEVMLPKDTFAEAVRLGYLTPEGIATDKALYTPTRLVRETAGASPNSVNANRLRLLAPAPAEELARLQTAKTLFRPMAADHATLRQAALSARSVAPAAAPGVTTARPAVASIPKPAASPTPAARPVSVGGAARATPVAAAEAGGMITASGAMLAAAAVETPFLHHRLNANRDAAYSGQLDDDAWENADTAAEAASAIRVGSAGTFFFGPWVGVPCTLIAGAVADPLGGAISSIFESTEAAAARRENRRALKAARADQLSVESEFLVNPEDLLGLPISPHERAAYAAAFKNHTPVPRPEADSARPVAAALTPLL